MKKFISFTILVVTALMLGGCNDDSAKPYRYDPTAGTGGTSQTQPSQASQSLENGSSKQGGTQSNGSQQASKGSIVMFDLPTGWIRDEEKSSNRGIQWSASSDGVKPYVLAEATFGGVGTKDEAKQLAQNDHNRRMKYCDNAECAKWITYSEKNIAGIDVFISTDVNTYWGADSLSSILWFAKDGIGYGIDFDDSVDSHLEAVKKIIETIHVVNR